MRYSRASHPWTQTPPMVSGYGEGYAWSPSSLTVSVGDTVAWRWEAPFFIQGVGYRVFSVASPGSTTYDGVSFKSGDTKTESGTVKTSYTLHHCKLLNTAKCSKCSSEDVRYPKWYWWQKYQTKPRRRERSIRFPLNGFCIWSGHSNIFQ